MDYFNTTSLPLGNNTTGPPKPSAAVMCKDHYEAAKIITWIETVAIILLNGVLIGLLCSMTRRNRMSFFVLHLAIADLLVGLLYTFPQALHRHRLIQIHSDFGCRITVFMTHLVAFASSWMLAVLSFDRLYVILKPMPSANGRMYRFIMVASAWIISAIFVIPITMIQYSINGRCHDKLFSTDRAASKAIKTFTTIGMSLFPAIVIAVCFISIAIKLRKRRDNFRGISWSRGSSRRSDTEPCSYQDRQSSRSNGDDSSMSVAMTKSIQMCFVVISVFIICWSPFCINVLFIMHDVIDPIANWCAYIILMSLAPLNSVANPIVFFIFNKNLFGKKLKKVFSSKKRTKTQGTLLTCITSSDSARVMRVRENEKCDEEKQ